MAGRLTWVQTPVAVILGMMCLAAASMALSIETHSALAAAPLVVVVLPAAAYLTLTVDPAVTLTAGVFLTPFAGNWQQLGIPGVLAPDRLLIAVTIVLVVVQAVGWTRRAASSAAAGPLRVGSRGAVGRRVRADLPHPVSARATT